jgi:hypothetical protein
MQKVSDRFDPVPLTSDERNHLMDREYDDDVMAIEASPYVSKMQQYVDADRAIERMERESRNLEKQVAEARAMQAKLRRDLVGYLDPEQGENKPSRGDFW